MPLEVTTDYNEKMVLEYHIMRAVYILTSNITTERR